MPIDPAFVPALSPEETHLVERGICPACGAPITPAHGRAGGAVVPVSPLPLLVVLGLRVDV